MAHLPTPLEECPRLSDALGGPRILVKRDDATGLAFGGNKGRHFEYLMGEVTSGGYDVYVNVMDYVSNNARLTAAACNKVGVRNITVLRGAKGRPVQGNLLVDSILGAELHLLETQNRKEADAYAERLGESLRKDGHKPYVLSEQLFQKQCGVVAYVAAALEVADQLEKLDIDGPVRFFGVAGRSLSGLALVAKNLGLPWSFTGTPVDPGLVMDEYIFEVLESTYRLLDMPLNLDREDMTILYDYIGEGYGIPTPECIEAIKLMARTEAVMLDPNYTGKAMSGLIDQVRKGNVGKNETVVFLHTGGLPALFLYSEDLSR
jgi:1-aminocyclopropane-1-carboxylate deaminase/D-cysteine desulfhydrase-like pyridoxal-dependent ACC family enzyme